MNYFRGLPKELEEAATIDGASQWKMLVQIFLPVSLPVLATVSLFTMVFHWNSFFDGLILMHSPRNWPLQTYIQQLTFQINPAQMAGMTPEQVASFMNVTGINFNAAKIFVSMVPILLLYPFLQKFFITGIVLGSVKE
jgi:putative aldouronate transport system permease protein